MNDGGGSSILFLSFIAIILLTAIALAVWRMRKHAAQRAEAERRMGEAMLELNRLTARLRAEQQQGATTAGGLVSGVRAGHASGGGAASPA